MAGELKYTTMNSFLRFLFIVIALSVNYNCLFSQPFSHDTSFQSSFIFRNHYFEDITGSIGTMFEMEDGSIGLGGSFKDPTTYNWIGETIILFSNGQFNPNFQMSSSGDGANFYYNKPYLYGSGVVRWHYDTFERDTVFDYNRNISNWFGGWPTDMYFLPNGDYYLAGGIVYHLQLPDERRSYFCRIKQNGYYDTTFHHDANYVVKRFFRYDSTRTILTGLFTTYDGVPRYRIARIFNDGTLDTSFQSIFVYSGICMITKVTSLEDGKMLVAGAFHIAGFDKQLALVRLLPNGQLDSTFNNFDNAQSPIGLLPSDSAIYDMYYQVNDVIKTTNNKLMIGGPFLNYQGHYRGRIALADENGYLDTTVFTGLGIDSCLGHTTYYSRYGVNCIIPAQNDKYYVAGKFSGFNGQMVEPIIRLNPHDHVGIVEQEDKPCFSISPKPVSKEFVIELPPKSSIVSVYNSIGQLQYSQALSNAESTHIVNCSNWESGIYICRIKYGNNKSLSGKLLITQ